MNSALKSRPGRGAIDFVLPALLLVCVIRLWIMPLSSSFWVDEMATVFVVEHGASHPSFAAAPQVPASIYYHLPRAAQALFGSSEIVYRLPSVLAMALAVVVISRLASRLVHPGAAWFAAFGCIALAGFNYQAADARPYALGTMVSAAGILALVRWLDLGGWRDGILFALAAAALWRVHLLFWPFYLVFAGYALVRLARGEARVTWARAAVIFGLAGLSLVPVALEALALLRTAEAHVISKPPSLHAFEHGLRWNVVLISGAGAWLLAMLFRWPRQKTRIAGTTAVLVFSWWLIQPAALFVLSWATGDGVFVKRYYSIMMPGVAMASTLVAAKYIPAAMWKPLAALLGLIALVVLGQWTTVWPNHENSGWRAASLKTRELSLGPQTPVICPSPFIEARPPVWRPQYPLPGFLYSHLPVYPIGGTPHPFPFEIGPEAERYAAELTTGPLRDSRRFLIYGGNAAIRFWTAWFTARPELAGWRSTRHQFGDVDVMEFNAEPAR